MAYLIENPKIMFSHGAAHFVHQQSNAFIRFYQFDFCSLYFQTDQYKLAQSGFNVA